MKLYKTTFDMKQPSVKTITVPTDTQAFGIGIKVNDGDVPSFFKGSEMTIETPENTLSCSTTFNGYNVFFDGTDSEEKTKECTVRCASEPLSAEFTDRSTGAWTSRYASSFNASLTWNKLRNNGILKIDESSIDIKNIVVTVSAATGLSTFTYDDRDALDAYIRPTSNPFKKTLFSFMAAFKSGHTNLGQVEFKRLFRYDCGSVSAA